MPDKIIRVKKAHFERAAEDIMIAMMDVKDEKGLAMLWPRMENVIQLKVTVIARLMDLLESCFPEGEEDEWQVKLDGKGI